MDAYHIEKTDYQRFEEFVDNLKLFMAGATERQYKDTFGDVQYANIDPIEIRKGLIEDVVYFAQGYGPDMIPQDVSDIIMGAYGGRTPEEQASVEEELRSLRVQVYTWKTPPLYEKLRPVFDESAATIREMKDAMDKMAGVLNEIQTAQKKEGATLEDIRGILRSQEAREAKQARRDASQHGDAISEKILNQIGNIQKGVTMLLSSSEANVTPSATDAAEWYGVSVRTIQNWMSGAKKCDDWPGNSAPMSVYREYAARYKAKRRKAGGADDGGSWENGSSILDIGELNNGYSIK